MASAVEAKRKDASSDSAWLLYPSQGKAAKAVKKDGISSGDVSRCVRGQQDSAKGWMFRFADPEKRRAAEATAATLRVERERRDAERAAVDDRVEAKRKDAPSDSAWLLYASPAEAAEKCGVDRGNVSHCVNGHYDSTQGWMFRFADLEKQQAAVTVRARRGIWGSGRRRGTGARTSPRSRLCPSASPTLARLKNLQGWPMICAIWRLLERLAVCACSPSAI